MVSQYSSVLAPIAADAVLRLVDPETLHAPAERVHAHGTTRGSDMIDLRDIRLVKKVGGTIDDTELVDGLVLEQNAVTASGGPFRGRTREQLADVTPDQALAHPNFAMGKVITTNSATLVNKGLEVIEAHLLFGIDYDAIDVVVHPQSIVHSMVTFADRKSVV